MKILTSDTVMKTLKSAVAGAVLATAVGVPALANFDTGLKAYEDGQKNLAVEIWTDYARAGDVRSMKILGDIYSGDELEQTNADTPKLDDDIEALKWYTLAAVHEFTQFKTPSAREVNDQILARKRMHEVRFALSTKQVEEAEGRIADEFERGSAYDIYRLGVLYQQGNGVSKDNVMALTMYELADDRGFRGNDTHNKHVEVLRSMLTEKEMKAHNKALKDWQPPLPEEHTNKTPRQKELEETQKELETLELAKALYATKDIDLELIQHALNYLGFRAGTPDNKPGPQTQAASERFQAALKNPQTGELTPPQIVELIARAADQGHGLSQHAYGIMFARGIGVTENGKEARKWLNRAADQDIAIAHYTLGVLYRDGTYGPEPIKVDFEDAAFHFSQALTLGFKPAAVALEELTF